VGADQFIGIENSILGRLYSMPQDPKVRRWALNALAQLGHETHCREAILTVLENYRDDPDSLASGIAAIFKLCKDAPALLRRMSFDQQMVALSALQHAPPTALHRDCLPLNVETASSDHLKLALIVVGLDRAIPNMLNPNYSNAAMVKVIGGHHDPIVAQYSVWAITENRRLSVSDLGIMLSSIEQQPANVRSWIFQLIAMHPTSAIKHMEYIELGMRDPDADARRGLATGLKDTFVDGIEPLLLDWFSTELDSEVRAQLLESVRKHR
jgi:hypothetical protein